jgi:hypothetical protein
MSRSCVVSGVVKVAGIPVGEVARIDLKVTNASLRCDSYSVALSNLNAASAIWSRSIKLRKRIESAFKLSDIRGIIPLAFWPKFLNYNLQF